MCDKKVFQIRAIPTCFHVLPNQNMSILCALSDIKNSKNYFMRKIR